MIESPTTLQRFLRALCGALGWGVIIGLILPAVAPGAVPGLRRGLRR